MLYGFGSNLAAPDMLDLYVKEDLWQQARALCSAHHFAREHILAKDHNQYEVGPNIYPNLVAVNAFAKVREWKQLTVVGVGAIGQDDCECIGHVGQTLGIIDDIHKADGWVDYLEIDSPWSWAQKYCPSKTLEEHADALAFYSDEIKQVYPHVQIGFAEGFGRKSTYEYAWTGDEFTNFCHLLHDRGQPVSFLALDVDKNSLKEENWWKRFLLWISGADPEGYRVLKTEWAKIRTPLVHEVSLMWEEAEDGYTYHDKLMRWAKFERTLLPRPSMLFVKTWSGSRWTATSRPPGGRAIPKNLPETEHGTHTNMLLQIAKMNQ